MAGEHARQPGDSMDSTPADGDDIARLWSRLLPGWRGVVGAVHRAPEELRQNPEVPDAWVELFSSDRVVDALVAAWRPLPRFSAYLASSLLDAAVGTGMGGPVLVYLLRDWTRNHGESHPGLMLGGVPAGARALEQFQSEVGPLPAALQSTWLLHSFLLLKNGQWLGSLLPAGEVIAPRPRVAPGTSQGQLGGRSGRYECLEVFEPGSAVSGCVIRAPGEAAWRDHVVYRERDGVLTESHRPTLESTLTDWDADVWEEPS